MCQRLLRLCTILELKTHTWLQHAYVESMYGRSWDCLGPYAQCNCWCPLMCMLYVAPVLLYAQDKFLCKETININSIQHEVIPLCRCPHVPLSNVFGWTRAVATGLLMHTPCGPIVLSVEQTKNRLKCILGCSEE